MKKQAWMCVAWPAFLAAAVLEMVVFAVVDPGEMHWLGQALPLSRQGVYTLAFFVFWGVVAGAGTLTVLLASQPEAAALDDHER
jgi:hypothetical protein